MLAIVGFFLARCDLFGIPVSLTFAQQQKSRSTFGGICTLVFAIFALWSIIHSSQDLVYKQEPRILQTDTYTDVPKDILLSPDTFPFGFGLEGNADANFDQFIDETIYSVQVTLWTMIRSTDENGIAQTDWSSTLLEVERCTLDHFGKFQSLYTTFPVSDLYCLKQKQKSGLDQVLLQGTTEGDLFQYLNIAIVQCDNSASNNTCASPEAIESRLDSSWFSLFYADLAIDGKNYTRPDVRFRKSYYTLISTIMSKKGTLKLGHVEMTTDSGWLLKGEKTEEYVKLTGTEEFFDLKPDPDGFMYQTIIVADRLESSYDRSYIKIQESLAQAQGLITTLMIGLILCLAPYSRLKFYESLMNEIFHFSLSKPSRTVRSSNQAMNILQKEVISSINDLSPQLHQDSKDAQDYRDDTMNASRNKSRKKKKSQEITLHKGLEVEKEPKDLLILPSRQPSTSSQQITPLEMEKDPLSHLEAGINFKSESGLFMTTFSPEQGLNIPNRSQDKRIFVYSPENSLIASPKNRLLNEQGTRMLSFRSQPSVYTEGAIKIEMKDLKGENDDNNDDVFFHSMTQELPEDEKKTKVMMEEEKEQEEKEGEIVQNREDEGGEDAWEGFSQDSLALQNSKISQSRAKSNRASSYGRNNDKFNRLRRQFTDIGSSSFKVDISFWDLICSFFNKNGPAAQRIKVLRTGISNIQDRLDIFNLLKKLREIDKLKALLLEEDHRVLFNGLPKPEINLSDCEADDTAPEGQKSQYEFLKGSKFIEGAADQNAVLSLYRGVLEKEKKTKIDQKLIEIYDRVFNLQNPTTLVRSGQ